MRRFALPLTFLLVFTSLLALVPNPAGAQESTSHPGVTGNTYKSPTFGYKLAWDDSWSVIGDTSDRGYDLLGISNQSSEVILNGSPYSDTLANCPKQLGLAIFSSPHLSNIKPRIGANGKPVAGVTASVAYEEFSDTLAAQDGSTIPLFDRLECRWIVKGKSALMIDEEVRQATASDQEPIVQAVMSSLTMPAPSHKKSQPKTTAAPAGPPSAADITYLKTLTTQPAGVAKLSLDLYDKLMLNPQTSDHFWLNRLSYVFTGWVVADRDARKSPAAPARYENLHTAYLAALAPLIDATKQMTTAEDYVSGKSNVVDLSGVDYDALAKAVADSRAKFAAYDKLLNAARKTAGLPPLK